MSKEIQALGTHGNTYYAQIVRKLDAEVWYTTTPAFEAYSTSHISAYAITMTESGTASGIFTGNFPTAIGAGDYVVIVRQRVGGSAAETDPAIAVGSLSWNGTAVVQLASINAKTVNLPADPVGLTNLASAHGTGSYVATASVTVDIETQQLLVGANWGQIAAFAGSDLTLILNIKDSSGDAINASGWTFATYGALRTDHANTASQWVLDSTVTPAAYDLTAASTGTVKVSIERATSKNFSGQTHDVDVWRTDLGTDEDVKAYGTILWQGPARPSTT